MKNKIIFKTLMLKGEAGSTIVSMEKTGHVGTADIYTITFNDGSTTEISLENMSAITSVEMTSSTDTEDIYTITCADGSTQTFSVLNHNADIAAMSDDIDTIDARVDNFINSVVPNTVETLWTGSIKDVGDSATLSKAVSNFDYIDLYLLESADSKYIRVPATQTAVQIQQQNLSDDASSNFLRLWEMGVSISGSTVSITKSIAWAWDDPNNSNPTVTANAQNGVPITRIDGVKVASDTPAELTDIRVGADGTTYNSAGAAVRGQISDLKSDLNEVADEFGAIAPYKAYSDSYIDSTGTVASVLGHSIYEIPVKYGDIIVISDSGASKFYGSIVLGKVFNFKNNDDTYTHLGTGFDTKFVIRTDQDDYMLVIPSGVKRLSICADDNYYQNVSFRKNYATADFNGMLLQKSGVVSQIDSSWVISSNFYPRSSDGTFRVLTSNVFALAVKSGDIVEFQSLVSPYTYYGTFKDKSTLDVANITTAIFTAQSDGYVFAFGDNTSGIVYKPYNGIKIDKNNIVGLGKILDGKTYCAFGDSITAGNNLQEGEVNWTNLVVNELGGTLVNCGVGSSRVAGNQSTAFHKTARLDAVKADNPDIVTILGGANDLVAGYSIGTEAQFDLPMADKDTMTYLGAYSYIVENLLTWKPSLQIVILGMYYAYTDGTEYSDTLTYTMLSDASKKLAEHYCLPFIDLHNDTGFNQFTMGASPNNIYTRDKIHPNQLGCNKLASIVIDEFKKLFSL